MKSVQRVLLLLVPITLMLGQLGASHSLPEASGSFRSLQRNRQGDSDWTEEQRQAFISGGRQGDIATDRGTWNQGEQGDTATDTAREAQGEQGDTATNTAREAQGEQDDATDTTTEAQGEQPERNGNPEFSQGTRPEWGSPGAGQGTSDDEDSNEKLYLMIGVIALIVVAIVALYVICRMRQSSRKREQELLKKAKDDRKAHKKEMKELKNQQEMVLQMHGLQPAQGVVPDSSDPIQGFALNVSPAVDKSETSNRSFLPEINNTSVTATKLMDANAPVSGGKDINRD